jgi:hypothetical protein
VHKNKDKRADYSTADAYGALGEHARQYIELLRRLIPLRPVRQLVVAERVPWV